MRAGEGIRTPSPRFTVPALSLIRRSGRKLPLTCSLSNGEFSRHIGVAQPVPFIPMSKTVSAGLKSDNLACECAALDSPDDRGGVAFLASPPISVAMSATGGNLFGSGGNCAVERRLDLPNGWT